MILKCNGVCGRTPVGKVLGELAKVSLMIQPPRAIFSGIVDSACILDRTESYLPMPFPNNFNIVEDRIERLRDPIALMFRKINSASVIASLEGPENIGYVALLATAREHYTSWAFMVMGSLNILQVSRLLDRLMGNSSTGHKDI